MMRIGVGVGVGNRTMMGGLTINVRIGRNVMTGAGVVGGGTGVVGTAVVGTAVVGFGVCVGGFGVCVGGTGVRVGGTRVKVAVGGQGVKVGTGLAWTCHILTIMSELTPAKKRPSGLKATPVTSALGPEKVSWSSPVSAFHARASGLWLPAASR